MKFLEIKPKDTEYIKQIIEIEAEAFGKSGGVDEWILKPIVRYGKVFILLKDQEVLGVAEYMRDYSGKKIYLYGFCIKDNYRKNGLGKKLLEESISFFKRDKIEVMSLTVAKENNKAINLYKKLGFEKQELLTDEYGKGIHRLYYVKQI